MGADGSSCRTRSVVVEIKQISAQNVIIHTENSTLELLLDCSVTQVEKDIRRMCGIDESSRRRGFEGGSSRKAPFVLRTTEQLEMLPKASCT